VCTQSQHKVEVHSLHAELAALRAELTELRKSIQVKPALHSQVQSPTTATPGSLQPASSYATAVSANTDKDSQRTKLPNTVPQRTSAQSASDRKFNIVMYGIKECPKGTPKHARMASDMKSVCTTVQSIYPELSEHSICDSTRLGKYSSEHTRDRPILVKFSRSCDVSNILINRRKLVNSAVSIKPFMTKSERATESALLRERRSLITSGTEKSSIKIRGNSLYINNSKYGVVKDSVFTPCHSPAHSPVNMEDIETSSSPNPEQ